MLKSKIELFVPYEVLKHKGSSTILQGSILLPVFPLDIYANIERQKVGFLNHLYHRVQVLILRKGKAGKRRIKPYKTYVPTLVPKSDPEPFLDYVCKKGYTVLRKVEMEPFDVTTTDSYTFLYMAMGIASFILQYTQMTVVFAKDNTVANIYDNINDIIASYGLEESDETLSEAIDARFGDKQRVWQELQWLRVLLGRQRNLDHIYEALVQGALKDVLLGPKLPLKRRSILSCKRARKAIQLGKDDNLPIV